MPMPITPPPHKPPRLVDAQRRTGAAVPSPCVGVCRMSPSTGYCEGCWRTLEEIGQWGRWTDAERLACWRVIETRT